MPDGELTGGYGAFLNRFAFSMALSTDLRYAWFSFVSFRCCTRCSGACRSMTSINFGTKERNLPW